MSFPGISWVVKNFEIFHDFLKIKILSDFFLVPKIGVLNGIMVLFLSKHLLIFFLLDSVRYFAKLHNLCDFA